MACVALSRASFAEPPAESPSTKNNSFSRMSSLSQSVSLPGNTATPLPDADPLRVGAGAVDPFRAVTAARALSRAAPAPTAPVFFP